MATTDTPLDGGKKITLSEPSQLIAAVPYLLGFRPADSVVLVGRGLDGKQVGPVLRADLPTRETEMPAVSTLSGALARQAVSGVTILIVGKQRGHPPHPRRPPHARLVKRLTAALGAIGLSVDHAVWVPEIGACAPWECYHRPKCSGTLPDDSATVLAATMAGEGVVTFSSREEVRRLFDPDDPDAVERRDRLLDAELDALAARGDPDVVRDELIDEVIGAVDRARSGCLDLPDELLVRLAAALSDHAVRDFFLATAVPAGSESSRRTEALWLELVRRLPVPERAEPAALLAYSAYVRGEGTLARMACETALHAVQGHVLAGLFLHCLECAIPPEKLRGICPEDWSTVLSRQSVRRREMTARHSG